MWKYVVKRVLALIPVIIAVSLLVFIMIDLAPGNALDVVSDEYSEEEYQALVHELGYDRSVFYRYFLYVKGIFRGSLGTSIIYKMDVLDLYMQRFPSTMKLAVSAFLFSTILSIPLGVFSAVRHGKISDNAAMVFSVLGLSIPNFWLGLMLIVLFSLKLKWFPSSGDLNGVISLILPMITIGTEQMAAMTRTTRTSMVDVIRSEYLLTARAKGVPERVIIYKHALRNALIPIITVAGATLGSGISGSALTEIVFAWPGVGRLMVDAIKSRDTAVITGSIIMTTAIIAVLNLIVDLAYILADPRLHSQYTKPPKEKRKPKKLSAPAEKEVSAA